jgi:hypothetical protein
MNGRDYLKRLSRIGLLNFNNPLNILGEARYFDDEIRKIEERITILKNKKEYCQKYLDVFVNELEEKTKN